MTDAAPKTKRLDDVDRRVLAALSRDGRRAAADLAKELGLSRQAVTERIRELERSGVIRGYRADVDPARLGLAVHVQIRLTLDGPTAAAREKDVLRRLKQSPYVRSVHRVSGEDCFVVEMVCREIADVNALLTELQGTRALQSSRTAFVMEELLARGAFGPLDESLLVAATVVPAPERRS